jgi:hypothetical protein
MSTLPRASASFTVPRLVSTALKSGAVWPTVISGPLRVTALREA